MNIAYLLEAGMLICFGFSWPLNVVKAYKARTAKGTSLAFIFLIITGYVSGIAAKFVHHQFNYVLAVYFLNLAIVSLNVFVYFRNRALDKKKEEAPANHILKFGKPEDFDASEKVSQEQKITELQTKTTYLEKNGVILLGGAMDRHIPVDMLSKEFDFDFAMYNKSQEGISVGTAAKYFAEEILPLAPEGILLHLGENDVTWFKNSTQEFDNAYLNLIDSIKAANRHERIALVSVVNENHDKTIAEMNSHIKAIADAENCTFINLSNAKLWNPEATIAANDFAYSMGVRARKPLKNVAEILYSYAYKEFIKSIPAAQELIG